MKNRLNIVVTLLITLLLGSACTTKTTSFKIVKEGEAVYLPFIQVNKEKVKVSFNENNEYILDVTAFKTPFIVRYHVAGKMKKAYVSEGSSQVITLSKTDSQHAGDNASHADYLNSRKLVKVELLETDSESEAIAKVKATVNKNLEELRKHNLGDVFNELQKTSITYLSGIHFLNWIKGLPYVKDLSDDDLCIQYLYELLSQQGVMNSTFHDFAGVAINFLAFRTLEESFDAADYIDAVVKMTVKYVKRDGAQDQMVNYYISKHIKNVGINGLKPVVELAKAKMTDLDELEQLNTLYAKWEHLEPGKKAYNWTFNTIDGEKVSLSDFKGKYVYIDLWATWCNPCVKEIPHVRALEKEFHGKDIVFVGISRDEDVEKWKNKVKTDNIEGIQVNEGGNTEFAEYLNITAIPRFVLIGKEGEILNAACSRPSNPKTRTLLQSLLTK